MKEIPGDQEAVRAEVPAQRYDMPEALSDLFLPLLGPGHIRIRRHTPVHIGSVNEFHG